MHWKRYKALTRAQKNNEAYYIIGLDIGNDSSGIAFFNLSENAPEIIDLSGGYGRPSIPTVMQYIAETKEWVFGEYAILNRGAGTEITLSDLIRQLGNFEYIDLDQKPVSVVQVLSLFIRELLGSVKNINPKAEIVGIVAAVPGYFNEQAREELHRAFKMAGYEKELIAQVADRECVLAHYYLNHKPREERVLLLDYGARGVRGGVYDAAVSEGDVLHMRSLSSLFDDSIGTKTVYGRVQELFREYLSEQVRMTAAMNDQLQAFTYQHKDILFQKNIRLKPVKLYFNFAYPPFMQTVTAETADALTEPFRRRFTRFIQEVFEKNLYGSARVTLGDIDTVLCVGGGFEMQWARDAVASLVRADRLRVYKNAKAVTAMGAAVYAARALDAAAGYGIEIEDRHQLRADIGIAAGRFIPLAECNGFWWQKHAPRTLIVNAPVDGEVPLTIISRAPDGETRTLAQTRLTGLPARPKGTTRLTASLVFSSDAEAMATVTDAGFGELFPKTEYIREIALKV
jgi:molecular chaperone DnaK (HSP70)